MVATVHTLKVTLRGVKPPIWRRIEVASEITLAELSTVLEAAMGWFGGHLHAFEANGVTYEPPDPEGGLFRPTADEAEHRLNSVLTSPTFKMRWDYDFGDGWQHTIVVEAIEPADDNASYPRCINGRRACPPEDCGGAETWFAKERWGDEPRCPHCDSANVQSGAAHKTMPYRCRERECRKRFSVRVGTIMEDSKLSLQTWALAFYLLTTGLKGTSSMKLHRDLGITQKSAWHLAHRIRETWVKETGPFSGPVEADETFVGGKERNKHASQRQKLGRGPVGKTAVVAAKDRATGKVSAKVVSATDRATLQPFVVECTQPGALVFTDEHSAYRGIPGVNHRTVKHSVGEYVDGQAHTNGVESFWSMLKRGYHGTFHHVSAKHLDRYVGEFSGRHNDRPADTIDQMRAMTRGMVGKRLRYADLIE